MSSSSFKFGENWKRFAERALKDGTITQARLDFERLCSGIQFSGKRFLDVGFGQGLSLCLAAEKGAECTGFDLDPVAREAFELTLRRFHLTTRPKIVIGSILDSDLCANLASQGRFDIVHSWGVLHHTGNLRQALANVTSLVKEGGYLIIAIYNRHWSSPFWKVIKIIYNRSPRFLKLIFSSIAYPLLSLAYGVLTKQSSNDYSARGMDFYYDVLDWIGGFPYEYMSKDEILAALPAHYRVRNYIAPLVPTGNHQFVFQT